MSRFLVALKRVMPRSFRLWFIYHHHKVTTRAQTATMMFYGRADGLAIIVTISAIVLGGETLIEPTSRILCSQTKGRRSHCTVLTWTTGGLI
jgi:hypothetical protein